MSPWWYFARARTVSLISCRSCRLSGRRWRRRSPAKSLTWVSNLKFRDQKHLDLVVALANDPELLLLGEPTAGMVRIERGARMC